MSEVPRLLIVTLTTVPKGGEPQLNRHTYLLELASFGDRPLLVSAHRGTALTKTPLSLRFVSLRPTVIKSWPPLATANQFKEE